MRTASLAVLAIAVTGVATRSQAAAQNECPTLGDFTNPDLFDQEAAKGLIVRVQSWFEVPGADGASPQPSLAAEGKGFVVAEGRRRQSLITRNGSIVGDGNEGCLSTCLANDVVIVTAEHIVLPEGSRPTRITISTLSDDAQHEAEIVAWDKSLDIAVVRASVPYHFIWTDFRRSETLEPGETISFGEYDRGELTIRQERFVKRTTDPTIRLVLNASVADRDSGSPVFDANWRIVGMVTSQSERAAEAWVVPSELLALYLLSAERELNLTTVAQMRARLREEEELRLEQTWNRSPTLVSLGAMRVDEIGAPTVGILSLLVHASVAHWEFLGVAVVGASNITVGSWESDFFFELGPDIGLGLYVARENHFMISLLWSPSYIAIDGDGAYLPLGGYKVRADIGIGGVRFGADVRPVSPFGSRDSYVEFTAFAASRFDLD